MKETVIRFWSGLHTIGSNIVSLQNGDYRLIMDFGALAGADINRLCHKSEGYSLLSENLLPKIDGLYDQATLATYPLESLEDSSIKTILCLSHLHLDHIGSFGQLSDKTPVYALQESVDFYAKLKETNLLPAYNVNWQGVQPGEVIEHGPFLIEFVPVDHDTMGAASVFVTTPDTKLIYSGDWRLTGFEPEKMMSWAQKANAFHADLLLMEGTTFSHVNTEPSEVDIRIAAKTTDLRVRNEWHLIENIKKAMADYDGRLVAFNGYPQNVRRMIELVKVANKMGREFVFNSAFYQMIQDYVPADLRVRELSERDVTVEMIQAEPEKYMLQVEEESIDTLLSLPAGLYLHSNGMPLGSYMPSYEPFVNRIVDAGWEFVIAAATGHASTRDLLLMNAVIRPKVIVPWHTFQPETYAKALQEQGQLAWLPEYDQTYTWSTLAASLGVLDEKN
ncbi:MBL fold metallo-hydrolase [Aerococcaceae bacterium zg-ZUI334]|uniref:MBL fold metallo-hydrolase n=1 Tax=Aerococcaceae bacterium zg-252 TaxID=2796928 RepID=UPI001B8F9E3D|nr:MBL fold metallo-hydrolase [Aerococcaceae bacterium zg-ZUI334]